MDQEVLVEPFQRLFKRLHVEVGPVALLMLLSQDLGGNAWTALCSAQQLDNHSRSAAVKRFAAALKESLDATTLNMISRIAVLKTDDPFVLAMNRAFHVSNGNVDLRECNVFGFDIPAAHVFHSENVGRHRVAAG